MQAFINFVLPAVWYLQDLYAVFDNESDILYDESGTFSSLMSTFLPQRYLLFIYYVILNLYVSMFSAYVCNQYENKCKFLGFRASTKRNGTLIG